MTPRHAVVETPTLGEVTLVAATGAMTGLFFKRHYPKPEVPFGERVEVEADRVLTRAAIELREYLAGERTTFDLPLRTAGDPFLQQVWSLVQQIPYGSTTTYGAIAERLGDRSLAQQVGYALGRNPLCVLIPCHRVVGATGSLTGYAGGAARKGNLLDLERGALLRDAGIVPTHLMPVQPG